MHAMNENQEITLHGHRVAFRYEGSGPLILLIHGITGRSAQWEATIDALSDDYTVLAPDLLGHGESAKPRGDYSLGSFASGLRDITLALGHESATVVGHSLGGGIAMQFAYQFPERCERLALVSSGGLGREVHPILRAATLPGSEIVLPLITHARHPRRRRGGRQPARAAEARRRAGRARGRPRIRLARRRRRLARLRPDDARRPRRRRPAGQRDGPPLPRRRDALAARLGRERPDHPGRARRGGPRRDARQPLRGPRPRPATSRRSSARASSPRILRDFVETTEAAGVDVDEIREQLLERAGGVLDSTP